MKLGRDARARAISTLRRSPPDSATAGVRRKCEIENSAKQIVEHGFTGVADGLDDLQDGPNIILDGQAPEYGSLLR